MIKLSILPYLVALLLFPYTSQAGDVKVWLCDCLDFKATVTITDKYFELVHHTKNEAGEFLWQRVNYKEIAGDSVHPRYVEKIETPRLLEISQLKGRKVDGVQYFTFESATLYPSNILVSAQDTRYSQCVVQPARLKYKSLKKITGF